MVFFKPVIVSLGVFFSAIVQANTFSTEVVDPNYALWYDVVSEAGSLLLINPRVATTPSPGVNDKQNLWVGKSGSIKINMTTVHNAAGGNCPTNFEHTIKLN